MLRRAGYDTLLAGGGEAAVAILLGEGGAQIDAVVLDLGMPDLDGLGVVARMREAGLSTPVIVQTVHGGAERHSGKFVEACASHYNLPSFT